MTDAPLVSVVVPVRSEATRIEGSLRAILAQDWPNDALEVIVVDGCSDDGTARVAERVLQNAGLHGFAVIDNPVATTPSNLNVGLAHASGEYLCRVDARSRIPTQYVRTCAGVLGERSDVMVVGGSQRAVPPTDDAKGWGIARALNNRYAMGMARYRRGAASGPTDTVYLGFFRTADLRAVGGWNEEFPTNQDFELNRRLGTSGMVWFDPSVAVEYMPRATLDALRRQYLRFGIAKVDYWRSTGDLPRPRQLVMIVVPAVAGISAVVLAGPSRGRWVGLAAVAGVSAWFVDRVGSQGPAAGVVTRLWAVAAMGTTAGAWLGGVWGRLAGFGLRDLPAFNGADTRA